MVAMIWKLGAKFTRKISLLGTEQGVEGLPVEMVRGLGLLCVQLHLVGGHVSDPNVFIGRLKSSGENREVMEFLETLELTDDFVNQLRGESTGVCCCVL